MARAAGSANEHLDLYLEEVDRRLAVRVAVVVLLIIALTAFIWLFLTGLWPEPQ